MRKSTVIALALGLAAATTGYVGAAEEHRADAAPAAASPAAHLEVAPPVPSLLANGIAVIPFRVENIKIMPVYGEAALAVMPRLGHLHVTVDDQPWHWVQASDEPLVIQGLVPGAHKILLELADPAHRVIDAKSVSFEIARHPVAAAKP
jgi:hypothetical protein